MVAQKYFNHSISAEIFYLWYRRNVLVAALAQKYFNYGSAEIFYLWYRRNVLAAALAQKYFNHNISTEIPVEIF